MPTHVIQKYESPQTLAKYRNDLILSVSVVLCLKAVFSPLTPFSLQIHECPTRTRAAWWKCAAQRLKEETRDSLPSASSRCPFLSVFSPFAVPQVNTTISFYNGIRARPEDFNPDTWETNNYKVAQNGDGYKLTVSRSSILQTCRWVRLIYQFGPR